MKGQSVPDLVKNGDIITALYISFNRLAVMRECRWALIMTINKAQ